MLDLNTGWTALWTTLLQLIPHRNTRVRLKERKLVRCLSMFPFHICTRDFLWVHFTCMALQCCRAAEQGGCGSAKGSGWVWEGVKCGCLRQLTSAYSLFLSRQDSRGIDDADALQDGVRHLRTHESAEKTQPWERGGCRVQRRKVKTEERKDREYEA